MLKKGSKTQICLATTSIFSEPHCYFFLIFPENWNWTGIVFEAKNTDEVKISKQNRGIHGFNTFINLTVLFCF